MFLSLIIPAFNEEKRIDKILSAATQYFSGKDFDYEVIVVDDGSFDRTIEVSQKFKDKLNNFKIIKNDVNCGKGCAVKKGMLAAMGEYRLFSDADNSTPLQEFDIFLPFLKDFDIVIGSRALKNSQIKKRQFWLKVELGRLGNKLINCLLKLKIADTQCGFKCFSAKAAESIFSKQKINGWGFDVEDLVIAKKMGLKIKEVGVIWLNDVNSKVGWKDYLRVLKEIMSIYFKK